MSEALPVLIAGVSGAEEESRAFFATLVAQFIQILRAVLTYVMEYMKRFWEWAGQHPLAATLFIANMAIWIAG